MLGRALIWASEKERIKQFVTQGKLAGVAHRFVAGDHLEDAIQAIKELNAKGIGGILDLLGEGVTDPAGAAAATSEYMDSIARIDETGIDTTVSIKLTQLGLAFDKGTCIDYVRKLAAEAGAIGTRIEIDMEQSEYVVDTLDVYRLLSADYPDLRIAMQVYLRRTPVDLETLSALKPRVRLVKGAYAEPEEIAFQKRREIDAQYRFLTEWLFDRGTDPGMATHDTALVEHAQRVARARGVGLDGFEIQMLYGIRQDYQEELARQGHRVRAYVPYGTDWYAYLMRRMAERPANLRFFLRALAGK
ncbi:MAG TPA: proline dehydrogenase family protein [Actinomycetota bacterium]|nr:proline dehydrogenase family protein [Actinomycetota bacterium]